MRTIFFDLDNTLYDVAQYFSVAFDRISEYLSSKYPVPKQEIYGQLLNLWKEKSSMYPHLFNDVLRHLDLENEIRSVIKMFNECDVELKLYKDVTPTIKELMRTGYKLGLITDGNVKRQKRKIKALGIAGFFDVIIYTVELNSPKSSIIPFQEALNKLRTNSKDSFYIGDNPVLDFEGAKEVGMRTVRLLQGEFSFIPKNGYIDYEIKEIKEILNIVRER